MTLTSHKALEIIDNRHYFNHECESAVLCARTPVILFLKKARGLKKRTLENTLNVPYRAKTFASQENDWPGLGAKKRPLRHRGQV